MIAIPIETLETDAAPSAKAIGSAPSTVARLVIKMGRNLDMEASFTASRDFNPSSFRWLANSTIRIPFLVTIPTKTMIPI